MCRLVALASIICTGSAFAASPFPAAALANSAAEQAPGNDAFSRMKSSLPWQIALTQHEGTGKDDEQLTKLQQSVSVATDPRAQLERLGWLFVAKARSSHDSGYYKLAEQCALALLVQDGTSPDALLLKGHVAQSLHRFSEAEAIGRQLVAQRELAFDHGLLGDALADQGKLDEAIAAYQRMVDLRPELQSYSRVAHVRWLRGDLEGAIEAATLAVRAAGAPHVEAAAWAYTRLAALHLQARSITEAWAAFETASAFVPDYPPALLLGGRMLLAAGKSVEAADLLQRAVAKNPLPEYQWALTDALRGADRAKEAGAVEAELRRAGAATDPRTYALFLATRGEQIDLALRLSRRELKDRSDIFTYDALAWALTAAGHHAEAWAAMDRALAEGTQEARLFLHAAVIAVRLRRDDAPTWLARARGLAGLLLPSEREQLDQAAGIMDANAARGVHAPSETG